MNQSLGQLGQRELAIGDRIRVQHDPRGIPNLLGQVGTIVEIFRVPFNSCMVQIDGDPNRERSWLLYRDEIEFHGE